MHVMMHRQGGMRGTQGGGAYIVYGLTHRRGIYNRLVYTNIYTHTVPTRKILYVNPVL